jgi:Ca2+-binding EF-hand superfamily protein
VESHIHDSTNHSDEDRNLNWLERHQIQNFINHLDQDGDGKLHLCEVLDATHVLDELAPESSFCYLLSTHRAVFEKADKDGDEHFSAEEIPNLLYLLEQKTQDLMTLLKDLDQDGDGKLNFQELYLIAENAETLEEDVLVANIEKQIVWLATWFRSFNVNDWLRTTFEKMYENATLTMHNYFLRQSELSNLIDLSEEERQELFKLLSLLQQDDICVENPETYGYGERKVRGEAEIEARDLWRAQSQARSIDARCRTPAECKALREAEIAGCIGYLEW